MPDYREHRGPHPEDHTLFSPEALSRLRSAVDDFSWLLSRSYAPDSALKIVGDHHLLNARQRTAVMRCSCSDQDRVLRASHQVTPAEPLFIDAYNVITTIEAALAGGVLIVGRDGCLRDMASMHGSWRKVAETGPAIGMIGGAIGRIPATWLVDAPVSNSGRLKSLLLQCAADSHWPWEVHLVANPDADLKCSPGVVATADSVILDNCARWTNLARELIARNIPSAWIVDLG